VIKSAVPCADAAREEPQGEPDTLNLPLTPQAVIDALIDIDLTFERRCKELSKSTLGATLQYHRLEKLQMEHRRRREPYVRQLIALQDELKAKGES
jgi:hypothetical protein